MSAQIDDKAFSVKDDINALYDELKAGQHTNLVKAVKLGSLLNVAKGAVGHGKWADWLKTNCPKISQRTANVYMKLAEHKDKFIDQDGAEANSQHAANFLVDEDLSIRGAIERVNKAHEGGIKTKPPKPPKPPKPKGDPEVVIGDLAPDEVADIIEDRWDDDKRIDLLLAMIRDLKPAEIITAVIEAVGDDAVAKSVADGINRQLQTPLASRPVLRFRPIRDQRPSA
jgi:hypothetical protein